MIDEMRVYHCVSGRLPKLLKRFETTALRIWAKHGIKQAGFFSVELERGEGEWSLRLTSNDATEPWISVPALWLSPKASSGFAVRDS